MKITCESCGAKYTIADEKVRGRRVKVRCKSCSTAIVVDGSQPLSAYDETTDEATHVMQPPSFGDSGAPPPDPDLWSVNLSDTDQRDMTTAQIVEGWRSGLVTEDAFVWKEGMADWLPVLEVGELALAFGSSQPGSATPAMPTFGQMGGAPPEAARVSPARAQSADLFGAIHTAGNEAEATQAPAPASGPYSDPKPTGARNENSVLFSLDALKSGFGSGPSAAAAPKAAAPAQARTGDKADLNELMGIGGGGGPLFGLSANQALLTAPAAPPERTPASVPPAAHSASFGMPARPNRTLLIGIGAGAVAIVTVILVVVFHHGSSNKAVAETDQSATPADSAKPSDSAAKPAASAQVAAKPSAAPAASSAPPANLPPFNRAAAIKALGVADKDAKACKKAGGPHGTGKVIITFDTSGKITKAKVEGGHYPGSDVGKCVAAAFLKVQIPAFSGKSITAARHFEIP